MRPYERRARACRRSGPGFVVSMRPAHAASAARAVSDLMIAQRINGVPR
jgi:hypothetical protein